MFHPKIFISPQNLGFEIKREFILEGKGNTKITLKGHSLSLKAIILRKHNLRQQTRAFVWSFVCEVLSLFV